MTLSDTEIWLPNISFPICTSFKPTILEGQLCYKIHVNASSGMGKNEELALVLDYQSELSIQAPSEQEEDQNYKKVRNLNFNTVENLNTEAAKVHIDTLSSFKGFGGGIYQLTDVKRMTAKKDFLKMPLEERKCEVELYESCRTRRLMQKCNCVPWEIQEFQVLVRAVVKKMVFLRSG